MGTLIDCFKSDGDRFSAELRNIMCEIKRNRTYEFIYAVVTHF